MQTAWIPQLPPKKRVLQGRESPLCSLSEIKRCVWVRSASHCQATQTLTGMLGWRCGLFGEHKLLPWEEHKNVWMLVSPLLGRAAAAFTTPAPNAQSSLRSHIVVPGKRSHSTGPGGQGYGRGTGAEFAGILQCAQGRHWDAGIVKRHLKTVFPWHTDWSSLLNWILSRKD